MRILLLVGVLVGVIVAVDHATKEIAVRKLTSSRRRLLRVVVTERPLSARGASQRASIMTWVAAVACAVAAFMCAPAFRENPLVIIGVATALAGASGNLVDQLVRGAVVDFVALGRWPVFNLADVAILAGAALAGASLI